MGFRSARRDGDIDPKWYGYVAMLSLKIASLRWILRHSCGDAMFRQPLRGHDVMELTIS